ncbi:hypothetical protein ACODM8_04000 [Vibrio ostreicida]|uniref:Uncharacterized protein n=1 Tax=Vibrio ostreicida TaxID=526588 RepID=A0ABT8BTL8_9VIBR|nr:hypothetical protein [Vibrio ostreicida]MDN3610336.1 hypothetical protein [Vibrio ostreicida]
MRGFRAGYRFFPVGSVQNIVVRAAYDPRTLNPSDSGSQAIQQMDKRKSTILGGISYQWFTKVGMWEATAETI